MGESTSASNFGGWLGFSTGVMWPAEQTTGNSSVPATCAAGGVEEEGEGVGGATNAPRISGWFGLLAGISLPAEQTTGTSSVHATYAAGDSEEEGKGGDTFVTRATKGDGDEGERGVRSKGEAKDDGA